MREDGTRVAIAASIVRIRKMKSILDSVAISQMHFFLEVLSVYSFEVLSPTALPMLSRSCYGLLNPAPVVNHGNAPGGTIELHAILSA